MGNKTPGDESGRDPNTSHSTNTTHTTHVNPPVTENPSVTEKHTTEKPGTEKLNVTPEKYSQPQSDTSKSSTSSDFIQDMKDMVNTKDVTKVNEKYVKPAVECSKKAAIVTWHFIEENTPKVIAAGKEAWAKTNEMIQKMKEKRANKSGSDSDKKPPTPPTSSNPPTPPTPPTPPSTPSP